jgi:uncharacterized protein YlxP (DUF503 family)
VRHAESLKDKRKVVQSLVQKLRNLGFSVTEAAHADNPKQGSIGIAFAGNSAVQVDRALEEMDKLLIGDFEVLDVNRQVFDYSDAKADTFSWEPDEDDDI